MARLVENLVQFSRRQPIDVSPLTCAKRSSTQSSSFTTISGRKD